MSFEGDKLRFNNPVFMTPVTATSSRVIARGETFVQPAGLAGSIFSNLPIWLIHTFIQGPLVDGDMVFLHRQSMKLLRGELTWKDFFMPAQADMATRELWHHFNKYSPNGINYYPHQVENDFLPPEQLLDRYEQHVKNCTYCRGALQGVRRVMWAALGVAVVGIVTAVVVAASCAVRGVTGGWQVGLGGVAVSFVALKLWQVTKGLEKKFMFEPYIHQDKN
jgi:pheophorbide a oxygenase